jgi:acyl-CoA thioesterase-2
VTTTDAANTADADPPAYPDLADVLDLSPDPGGDPDRFLGQTPRTPLPRVFGGQVLGQALVAATRTVDPDRPVHSLHGYFLRPGDPQRPITFAVERMRDGRSFSARRTHALQGGRPILSMISSFQLPSEGLDHQDEMPDVPPPESLPSMTELLAGSDDPRLEYWRRQRPVDFRPVDGDDYLRRRPSDGTTQGMWMRATSSMPADSPLHAAALAYISDYFLLQPVLRRHGLTISAPGLKIASLDHAMWWHRPARVDQWLLYVLRTPSASGARGLGFGQIYSQDGVLACSVAQEGMIRLQPA